MAYYKAAKRGCQWVLTEKGYAATPDHIKHEREIGKPVFSQLGYKDTVPISWVNKGYVEEKPVSN